jgi:hypothetical protein
VDRFPPPPPPEILQFFPVSRTAQCAAVLINGSPEQISYLCMFCNRFFLGTGKGYIIQPEDRATSQTVGRLLCLGSGSQSAVVPWLGRSVDGCAMAHAISRRLAMVRTVGQRLWHGSGGRSVAVPWFGQSVGGRAMAQAVSCRPLTANARGIFVEQSAKGVVFSLYCSTAGQYNSTYAL